MSRYDGQLDRSLPDLEGGVEFYDLIYLSQFLFLHPTVTLPGIEERRERRAHQVTVQDRRIKGRKGITSRIGRIREKARQPVTLQGCSAQ